MTGSWTRERDTDLFRRIGAAAEALGTSDFHGCLLRILDCRIRSDMRLVLRYSRHGKPDYLVNEGLSQHAVDLYLSSYYACDPAYRLCRRSVPTGVISFHELDSRTRRGNAYFSTYAPLVKITDDLGMFLPGVGGVVVAIFLERRRGTFSTRDVEAMKGLYPLIRGLYTAHIERLFLALAHGGQSALPVETERVVMVEDANGSRVCCSQRWRVFEEEKREDIIEGLSELRHGRQPSVRLADGAILSSETLSEDFPVAPGGRMFVVEQEAQHPPTIDIERATSTFLEGRLTPRESEIVRLILAGHSIDDISDDLGISRGTVKNHRGRLYNKLGIFNERQLFSLYLEHLRGGEEGP